MEWLTPSQLNPFYPADLACTLCKVNLLHKEWPSHVWTADHQNRAYTKCGFWNSFDRSCVFVIYCNIAVQPISFMVYLRHTCGIEVKDFILVPGKPTVAILEFHSSKEYMTFLFHSKEKKIRCGELIVTHVTPATGISDSDWKSLVTYEGPKQILNYYKNGHIAISPIFPTPGTPAEGHSTPLGPSSSGSSQKLSGCPQGPESVRRLHLLAIDSGWPPPKFERQISDRLARKYSAKVTLNGRVFCSNILAGDYSTACKLVAASCLKALENENEISKQKEIAINPPPEPAPFQTPANSNNTHYSEIPSSLSSFSTRPYPNTNTSNFCRSQSLQFSSPLSIPTIAARISQPVKRKFSEDTVSSTDQLHIKKQVRFNGNNNIFTAGVLMEQQLRRTIQLPSPSKLFAVRASTSKTQNTQSNKHLKPEVELVFDATENEENYNRQPLKIGDDRGEILIVKEVWKKPEEELQNQKVKVKTETYASPWPKLYLHAEYIRSLKYPVDTLDKICLVCNWERPNYSLVVSQSSTEKGSERFSYKMTLNEMDYKNERVEKTKKRAKEKVARICLTALANDGEIPHPSIFMNASLNPVRRLENLIISRRLPKSSQDEPKYTVIEDLEDEGYYCEVTLNGECYIPSSSEKTEKEAKKIAAEFCLKKLSSFVPLYADGSFTEKAKTTLATMSKEIPIINESVGEMHAKIENVKNQCKNIFALMKIPEAKWKGAKAIVKKLKNLLPGLQAIMYKNWYMKLKSYTDEDQLSIFVFQTNDDKSPITPADSEEIEKRILQSSELFPGLIATKLPNTNYAKYFKQTVQSFQAQPSFILETNLNTLDEIHLCRLIHYISEFDSRFLPVLSLLRYWAKINGVRFHPSNNSKMRNIWGDPFTLDLLLVSFLGGTGVIPTIRDLLERKRTFSFNVGKICLPSSISYANEWKSNGHDYQKNSVEFWLSVLVLTRNFFLYYADRFKEGSWVFNICDSEMFYCLDLLYGSFHTKKLSPEDLNKLVTEGFNRAKVKKQNDSKMYLIIPINRKSVGKTNLNWGKMVNEMVECGSSTIFDLMRIAGTRLNTFLDDFPQNDLDLESTLNCLF